MLVTHARRKGSGFTPVSYYCSTATLNYIYSLVSCRIADLLLVFSWLQAAWPRGVSAAEGGGGGAWSLATRSLCGREQIRACPCLSFPTANNSKDCWQIPEAIVSTLLELLGFWRTRVFVELGTPGPCVRWDFWREDAKA